MPLLGITSASAAASTITFTRGDNSNFSVVVSQSGSVESASYALTASYVANSAAFPFTGSAQISGSLGVTGSINATNVNAGTPTSNQWQSNLNGSYFNNFTSQTDVSEILRFVAGLLSSSAPDASPNTKTYSTYTANAQNTSTGTVTAGSVPQGTSNSTITYLNSKGFANTGSTIFNGIATIYTALNYGYNYTSVAAGSTTVSSSADVQLFGLGPLSSGAATSFTVSGSFNFRFKDNSAKTDTYTSSSLQSITQTGTGSTSGVSLAKINTANPAVIPSAYQDGKYASVFTNILYSGSATGVSASGYFHISSSIAIASGSSTYTPIIQSNNEIFWAPLSTISTNIAAQSLTTGSTTATALTAVSRSLSGAPYLSGSTYNLSSSVNNIFNPLYYAGASVASLGTSGTGMTQTSGVTTVSTAGGTVQTAGAVYDSTGVTARSSSQVPYETDIIKLNGLYTFTTANITNIAQTSFTPTAFNVGVQGLNKNGTASTLSSSISYHVAGAFNQNASNGSLAYYTRTQGTDTATNGAASNSEPFTGENYRIVLNDNILTFTGTAWNTSYIVNNLGNTDLQVKPGYLVKPGGTYGYWLTNPSAASDYKYYVRKFTTNAATKTSMTLNMGKTLVNWNATTSDSVGALILFESSKSGLYTPPRFFDPSNLLSNQGNISANTDGQNPFGSSIAVYGNTTGNLASTTYTIPIVNVNGMTLDTTYTNIYLLVRYKGDPTPVSSITVTFS